MHDAVTGSLSELLIDLAASYRVLADADAFPHHAGLQMWKTEDDLARYRVAIEETRPDVLVETGTHTGGFAAWVADTFKIYVVSVDIAPRRSRPAHWPGVTFLVGDSAAAATADAVWATVRGLLSETHGEGRVMVTLDSDHHAPHVLNEMGRYAPLVTAGCHLVVEDGLADLLPPEQARLFGQRIPEVGGPLVAVSATLAAGPGWCRDIGLEGLSPVSHNPAGWWRRQG
jgi:cephalosporin hydroxylase